MGTLPNGYLVLQGNIHFGTKWFETVLELLARKKLGTHWSKYPFSRGRRMRVVVDFCLRHVESHDRMRRGFRWNRIRGESLV